MKQVKVTKTETYTDSQGEHTVCKGKLVLIDMSLSFVMQEVGKTVFPIKRKNSNKDDYDMIKLIIISETEEIEVGDKGWDGKEVFTCHKWDKEHKVQKDNIILAHFGNEILERDRNNCKKILALPKHFSPKHLQAIVDGKLKDGDEVYIECEEITWDLLSVTKIWTGPNWADIIKLTNNHIKLFPVKKEESWNDIFMRYTPKYTYEENESFMEWLEDNYNPPTRK